MALLLKILLTPLIEIAEFVAEIIVEVRYRGRSVA